MAATDGDSDRDPAAAATDTPEIRSHDTRPVSRAPRESALAARGPGSTTFGETCFPVSTPTPAPVSRP
jgi:hypothetical protein